MFCNIFSCFYKKNKVDIEEIKWNRIKTLPLYSSENVKKVNFFRSLITSINYLIWGDV